MQSHKNARDGGRRRSADSWLYLSHSIPSKHTNSGQCLEALWLNSTAALVALALGKADKMNRKQWCEHATQWTRHKT